MSSDEIARSADQFYRYLLQEGGSVNGFMLKHDIVENRDMYESILKARTENPQFFMVKEEI